MNTRFAFNAWTLLVGHQNGYQASQQIAIK